MENLDIRGSALLCDWCWWAILFIIFGGGSDKDESSNDCVSATDTELWDGVNMHNNHSQLSKMEQDFIAAQVERLTMLPFQDLCSMPEYTDIPVPEELAPFKAGIYREIIGEDQVRVVVQGRRDRGRFLFLKFSTVEADGFSMDREGATKKLAPKDLYDYM